MNIYSQHLIHYSSRPLLLIPLPVTLAAMARQVVVEYQSCTVFLSTVPAGVTFAAHIAHPSHSVSPPSAISTRRVLARTQAALTRALGAPPCTLPDVGLRNDCRTWVGRVLSAVDAPEHATAQQARDAVDDAFGNIVDTVGDFFVDEDALYNAAGELTSCRNTVWLALFALADPAFPSLHTARACLNATFDADAEERAAESVLVQSLRDRGLCLQDARGFLYSHRIEDALYDLQ